MSTKELKLTIHSLIDHSSDSAILQAIYTLLSNAENKVSEGDEISRSEKKLIKAGLKDIKEGRVIEHTKVMNNAREHIKRFKNPND